MFRNTGANAFAKNQMRLAYEDKRDLYCNLLQLNQSMGHGKDSPTACPSAEVPGILKIFSVADEP